MAHSVRWMQFCIYASEHPSQPLIVHILLSRVWFVTFCWSVLPVVSFKVREMYEFSVFQVIILCLNPSLGGCSVPEHLCALPQPLCKMVVILVIPPSLKDSTLYLSDGVAQAFLNVCPSPRWEEVLVCKVMLELKMLQFYLHSEYTYRWESNGLYLASSTVCVDV